MTKDEKTQALIDKVSKCWQQIWKRVEEIKADTIIK